MYIYRAHCVSTATCVSKWMKSFDIQLWLSLRTNSKWESDKCVLRFPRVQADILFSLTYDDKTQSLMWETETRDSSVFWLIDLAPIRWLLPSQMLFYKILPRRRGREFRKRQMCIKKRYIWQVVPSRDISRFLWLTELWAASVSPWHLSWLCWKRSLCFSWPPRDLCLSAGGRADGGFQPSMRASVFSFNTMTTLGFEFDVLEDK